MLYHKEGLSVERNTKNSKAKIAANNRYTDKAYDRINLAVKKGKKERIKEKADDMGISINAYINALIDADLLRKQTGKDFFLCDTEINQECTKTGCHINGGECFLTTNIKYAK